MFPARAKGKAGQPARSRPVQAAGNARLAFQYLSSGRNGKNSYPVIRMKLLKMNSTTAWLDFFNVSCAWFFSLLSVNKRTLSATLILVDFSGIRNLSML